MTDENSLPGKKSEFPDEKESMKASDDMADRLSQKSHQLLEKANERGLIEELTKQLNKDLSMCGLDLFIPEKLVPREIVQCLKDILKDLGLAWVVKTHHIEYVREAHQDDELIIRTWIEKVTSTRVTRCYECKRISDDQLIAQASTVWVIVDYESGRPKAFPKDLKTRFDLAVN